MKPLLLVTHARSDESFDNGMLSERIPEAVKQFPGDVAHIEANPDNLAESKEAVEPYGGEEIYDIHIEDTWNGFIEPEDAEELLDYQPISRAGTQFNNCCGNTDMALSAYANGDLQLNYFTDLTVYEDNGTAGFLENRENYDRPENINVEQNLEFRYATFFD